MQQDAEENPDNDQQLMDQLWVAMAGTGDISTAKRIEGEAELLLMRYGYELRWTDSSLASDRTSRQVRRSLHKVLATIANLRQQWQQLNPRVQGDITRAGWNLVDPDSKDALQCRALIEAGFLDHVLMIFDLNIRHHLGKTSATYRQSPLRTLLIEPFIRFLHAQDLLENGLPLNRKVKALLDWIGVPQRYRPTSANVAAIKREVKRALNAAPVTTRPGPRSIKSAASA